MALHRWTALACVLCSLSAEAQQRPNVLLIMADDLGYSDLGCFGGEIQTPNIDQLAADGLKFTRFRATPMCVTSRIALMAGMPFHRAGTHSYAQSIPLARVLKTAGYRTMMVGKWHAGSPDPRSLDLFDRAFGFMGGATDSFVGGNDWFFGTKPFTDFQPGFYATSAFADRSIEFMTEAVDSQQPFFMYVAFNAPHHPCQAPEATVRKYAATYQSGYQQIRKQRRERQIELGLIDPDFQEATPDGEVRNWNELSEHRRQVEAGRMAAYAAAVDEVDRNIGRMLQYLTDAGIAENTMVIFLSDNGGDYNNGAITSDESQIPWQAGSNPSSSNGWAFVKCTPFRFYKHACHEGGIATPLIIRWPAGIQQPAGTVVDTTTNITDIYPTLLQLSGAKRPQQLSGKELRSLTGTSLQPLFRDDESRTPNGDFQWFEFSKAWIEDEWKAVSLYDGPWQLFNLKTDRGETEDLAAKHPQRLALWIQRWQSRAIDDGVPNASDTVANVQRGWGWHRLKMACPSLLSLTPANGITSSPLNIDLRLEFDAPVDFSRTEGRRIFLYEVANEDEPVWQSDPTVDHRGQGKTSVIFDGLPTLKPNRHYSIRWDHGWAIVGGRPVNTINDGAYWWRFRTRSAQEN